MPKGGGRKTKTKDKWAALPQEWRDRINTAGEGELRAEGSTVAFNQISLQQQLKDDPDIKRLSKALKEARKGYTEGKKVNELKLAYLRATLESQGKDVGTFDPKEAKEEQERINQELVRDAA